MTASLDSSLARPRAHPLTRPRARSSARPPATQHNTTAALHEGDAKKRDNQSLDAAHNGERKKERQEA